MTSSFVFRDFLKREGIEVIRLPPRSPDLNAYAERWIRDVPDECLSRLIPRSGRGCSGVRFENTAPIFIKSATTAHRE
jgi:transposase InsO family protein